MSTLQQTLYNVHRKFAKRVLALFCSKTLREFLFLKYLNTFVSDCWYSSNLKCRFCLNTWTLFRLQKIARRKAAVDTLDWEDSKKERCKKFLIADYTSSDESEMSEDENGLDVERFVTKRLSWEGVKLTELKNFLDLAYKRSLSPHLRNLQTERVVGNKVSLRGSPPCAPKWTVRPSPLATSTPVREGRNM